jgi:hypothetical protein
MISIDEIYNLVSRAIKHNYDDYEDMDPFLSSLKLELYYLIIKFNIDILFIYFYYIVCLMVYLCHLYCRHCSL